MVALSLANSNKCQRIVLYKNTIDSDVAQRGQMNSVELRLVRNADNSSNGKYPQYGADTDIVHTVQRHSKRFTSDEIPLLIAEYKNGATVYELAEKYGCHRNTISKTLKRVGITVTIEKITGQDQINELLQLYENGLTALQIAERLGVSKTTVRRYLHKNGVRMRGRWDY